MTKKILIVLFLTVAAALLFLSGCGSPSPASSGGGGGGGAYYVNAASGADTNAGTQAAPFKTITKALNTASVSGGTINVTPGTYNAANGEVFPLKIYNNIKLIGDVANKGNGPVATSIAGTGNYTITAVGGGYTGTLGTTIVFPPAATSTVSGFNISGGVNVVVIVDNNGSGLATFDSNKVSTGFVNLLACAYSNASINSNVLTNPININIITDASNTATLRNNVLNDTTSGSAFGAILTVGTGAKIDAGTGINPGNNTIMGSASNVGWYIANATGTNISAVGNAWKPNVQGADAFGHYTPTFVPASGAAYIAGNNYAVVGAGTGGLQLYTSPAGAGGTATGSLK